MKLGKILMISFVLVTSLNFANAQNPDSSSALFTFREAERSFAKMSVSYGRKNAFAEYLADSSVIFREHVIRDGKKFWKEFKLGASYSLKWEPEYMDIAQSGDFGVSTGPWEIQPYQPYTEPLASGHYLSVWRKQNDGTWRVILDTGVGHDRQKDFKLNFSFPPGADKPQPVKATANSGLTKKDLVNADKAFLASWKANPSKETYMSYMSSQARIFRDGLVPTTDRDSIKSRIPAKERMFAWEPYDSDCSAAGDIGYTYGVIEVVKSDGKKTDGHYVRVWKKEQGSWKIAIDLVSEN